ncbi:MAG: hypothetical protein ABIH86_03125 [Planctomycetota bacterium]
MKTVLSGNGENCRCGRIHLLFRVVLWLAICLIASGCVSAPDDTPETSSGGWWLFGKTVSGGRVPLFVIEQNGLTVKDYPVRTGVSFPPGGLTDAQSIHMSDSDAILFPDVETLSTWPDGSVRWASVGFPVNLKPNESRRYQLYFGDRAIRRPLTVPPQPSYRTITQGRIRMELGADNHLARLLFDLNKDGEFSANETVLGDSDNPAIRPFIRLIDIRDCETAESVRARLSNIASFRERQSLCVSPLGPASGLSAVIEFAGSNRARVRIDGTLLSEAGDSRIPFTLRIESLGALNALVLDYRVAFNIDPHNDLPIDIGLLLRTASASAQDGRLTLRFDDVAEYPDFRHHFLETPAGRVSLSDPNALFANEKRFALTPNRFSAFLASPGVSAVELIFPFRRKVMTCGLTERKESAWRAISFYDMSEALSVSLLDPLSRRCPAWNNEFERTESFERYLKKDWERINASVPNDVRAMKAVRRARSLAGASLSRRLIVRLDDSAGATDVEPVTETLARPPLVVLPAVWHSTASVLPLADQIPEDRFPRAARALDAAFNWIDRHDREPGFLSGNFETGAYPTIYRRAPDAGDAPDVGDRWQLPMGAGGWSTDETNWRSAFRARALSSPSGAAFDRYLNAVRYITDIRLTRTSGSDLRQTGYVKTGGETHFCGDANDGETTYPSLWTDAFYLTGDPLFQDALNASLDAALARIRRNGNTAPLSIGDARIIAAAYERDGAVQYQTLIDDWLKQRLAIADASPSSLDAAAVAHRVALYEGDGTAKRCLIAVADACLNAAEDETDAMNAVRAARVWLDAWQLTGRRKYLNAAVLRFNDFEIIRRADRWADANDPALSTIVPKDYLNDIRVLGEADTLIRLVSVMIRERYIEPLAPAN